MAARMKNRVTTREEKALGSIDMNSLLSAGMCTGFVYAFLQLVQAGVLTIPGIGISFLFFLWILGKKGGVRRYMLLVYSWQARLLIAAHTRPQSLTGQFARFAGQDTADVIVSGDMLFSTSNTDSDHDEMQGLEILGPDALDNGAGGFEIVSDSELTITLD